MTMPTDIGAIDLMIGFPQARSASKTYDYLRADDSRATTPPPRRCPRATCSRTCPNHLDATTRVGIQITLAEMDRCGVTMGMVGVGSEVTQRAVQDHPDRFFGSIEIDPNDITGAVRKIAPRRTSTTSRRSRRSPRVATRRCR